MNRKTSGLPRRLSRRNLIKSLVATGAGWSTARLGWAADSAPAIRAMHQRPIPSSEEGLPIVGLGTSRVFDVGDSELERTALLDVVRMLVQHGGSLIDTSPMYGSAEAVVGDLVEDLDLHGATFLATKVWTRGESAGKEQMERSLERLRTDKIELMQVHNLVDMETHLKTLRDWKDQGRIRYIGITHYREDTHAQLEKIIASTPLDFLQINYSLLEPGAGARLLPLAAERGIAVIVNRPFARGRLFDRTSHRPLPEWAAEFDCKSWAQFFLKYVLANPAVTCVIPATSKARHMVDNAGAGFGRMPDAATVRRMEETIAAM